MARIFVPPPLPAEPVPPERKRLSRGLVVALIFAGVLGILCIATPFWAVTVMKEKHKALDCAENLERLAAILNAKRATQPDSGFRSGRALLLSLRKNGRELPSGEESVLICPADPLAIVPNTPETQGAYDRVEAESAPAGMCSYAGRDFGAFPLTRSVGSPEPLVACLHHEDRAVVAFDDGSVQFLTRADLGLGPDDPIEAGPESKSPILRKLCFVPGRAGR